MIILNILLMKTVWKRRNVIFDVQRDNEIKIMARKTPGGTPPKKWIGVCGPLPKTLTLFMTKICDFPYPIYDLLKHLIPYL